MDLSIIAIPILIIAIVYMFYYKKKPNTSKAKRKLHFKSRKFDLKSLESRVRRRMVVST